MKLFAHYLRSWGYFFSIVTVLIVHTNLLPAAAEAGPSASLESRVARLEAEMREVRAKLGLGVGTAAGGTSIAAGASGGEFGARLVAATYDPTADYEQLAKLITIQNNLVSPANREKYFGKPAVLTKEIEDHLAAAQARGFNINFAPKYRLTLLELAQIEHQKLRQNYAPWEPLENPAELEAHYADMPEVQAGKALIQTLERAGATARKL